MYLDIMNEFCNKQSILPQRNRIERCIFKRHFDRESQTDRPILISQNCQTEILSISVNEKKQGRTNPNDSCQSLSQEARVALFENHWKSLQEKQSVNRKVKAVKNKRKARKVKKKKRKRKKLLKFNVTANPKVRNRCYKIKRRRRKYAPWKP